MSYDRDNANQNVEQDVVERFFPTEQSEARMENAWNEGYEGALNEPVTKGDLLSAAQSQPVEDPEYYDQPDEYGYADEPVYDDYGNEIDIQALAAAATRGGLCGAAPGCRISRLKVRRQRAEPRRSYCRVCLPDGLPRC
jgi:hypothetical protein